MTPSFQWGNIPYRIIKAIWIAKINFTAALGMGNASCPLDIHDRLIVIVHGDISYKNCLTLIKSMAAPSRVSPCVLLIVFMDWKNRTRVDGSPICFIICVSESNVDKPNLLPVTADLALKMCKYIYKHSHQHKIYFTCLGLAELYPIPPSNTNCFVADFIHFTIVLISVSSELADTSTR